MAQAMIVTFVVAVFFVALSTFSIWSLLTHQLFRQNDNDTSLAKPVLRWEIRNATAVAGVAGKRQSGQLWLG